MPLAPIALAVGGFRIGLTEFVIAGLLPEVAASFSVDEATAGCAGPRDIPGPPHKRPPGIRSSRIRSPQPNATWGASDRQPQDTRKALIPGWPLARPTGELPS